MLNKIPDEVKSIYKKIESAGFEVYLVGGCVRDLLTEIPVKDWDLTTNAKPEEIQQIFPESFYDNSFGTVGVPFETKELLSDDNLTHLNELKSEDTYESSIDEKNYVEVTTFRTDHNYIDHRHPKEVSWGNSLEEDVLRRDFTMNALAIKIDNSYTEVIDLVNGQDDIRKRVIRAVGEPDKRFKEDALRILRAVRFHSQLGFDIEEKTFIAIKKDAHLTDHVSKERIRDEIIKILSTERAFEGICMLDEIGILDVIFPELTRGKGVSQARPGRHHTTDVFTHNILSLKETPSKNPLVRFAALLHDVGKPYVANKDEDGLIIFYNHEVVGSRIAKDIADRLHFSKKDREKIYTLIRWHMFTVDEHITDSAVRRFIRRVGLENVRDMLDLRIGDRLGGGTQTAESWRLRKFKERLEEQLNPPFSINDLAVDGNDIMKELNIEPGRKIGQILKILFEEVDLDLEKNTREFLIPRIHEIAKEIS